MSERAGIFRSWPRRFGGVAIVMMFGFASWTAHSEVTADRQQLKAALLYNFTQFIEWPAEAFASPSAPIELCVFGADAFGESLLPLERKTSRGRPITVRVPKTLTEARTCHVLLISELRAGTSSRDVRGELGNAPVLTVADSGVKANGVGIGFVEQGDRLRWVIDLTVLRPLKLKPNSKLLEIALSVIGE